MNKNISLKEWQSRAQKVLPGAGFGNFDPSISLKRGLGSRVWDEDNKEYIDFLIGSGPMILGHGNEEVLDAIRAQLSEGLTFFTNNSKGVELAEEICDAVKCAEQIRFVSSGGEADMYAMRLARAHTGRNKILKFEHLKKQDVLDPGCVRINDIAGPSVWCWGHLACLVARPGACCCWFAWYGLSVCVVGDSRLGGGMCGFMRCSREMLG